MITANNIALKVSILSRPIETEIYFGTTLEVLLPLLKQKKSRLALITDETIQHEYRCLLEELRIKIFSFPAGEMHKTRQAKAFLEDALLDNQFAKDSTLIAIGGGVVLDVAGFVAATFCRGIPLILIPTTLLGMVDACLGGKTAVNTHHGKNLIGSFYFPETIIIDPDFLNSLPAHQFLNGIAEMIKYGLIDSKPLFEKLEAKCEVKELIQECLEIKKKVIESDPYEEKGYRRILNFGHTFGHALELLENYQIPHGEAIAIGMILESYISMRLQLLKKEEFERIVALFHEYKFPLKLSRRFTLEELLLAFSRDKKSTSSIARLVVLKSIGQVEPFNGEYCTEVDLKLIKEAIEEFI
ncbi:MAG TPA: 3-dehydroquinate synthase [Rhabdochlamydiaceae bacterium]|nr:3-dehydroquinate synthase [Rhabdochlamydiaceae bacterium]